MRALSQSAGALSTPPALRTPHPKRHPYEKSGPLYDTPHFSYVIGSGGGGGSGGGSFLHTVGLDRRAYAFPYDDINDQSSVQILDNANPPTRLTLGIGW
ncbi:hypothetical protein ABZ656_23740 [Streptomyces sp. NPDC007095]|uniref:hypothetical protein n=1 Tax=Streptomyces sp. NPDC007095 TaxID=3154482 RepID=UPI0033CFC932